jgi:AraC family transcriptional regulator
LDGSGRETVGLVFQPFGRRLPSNVYMDATGKLKGGSFGEQRGLHLVGGFVVSETVHRQGQNLARHAHERASINFVLSGAYAETFRGTSYAHGPESIVVKPAGEAHANDFRDASAHCLLIELTHAPGEWVQACFAAAQAPASRMAPELKPIALRILRELRVQDVFSTLAMEANILELLVGNGRITNKANSIGAPRWLRVVIERLHDAPGDVRLSQLAADAGVHPTHLTRAFRKHLGKSPGEYARQIRLNRAIERLTTSHEPVGQIAVEAGFFDQAHFTRCVKQQTGMTPRELRTLRS